MMSKDGTKTQGDAPSFIEKGGLRFLLQVLLWMTVIAINWGFLAESGGSPLEEHLPTGLRILGGLLGAIGVGLTGASIYAFVSIDQKPNVFPLPESESPLITSGAYGFMRHPGYFGNVSLFIAGSLSLGSGFGVLSALLLLCPFYYLKAAKEEGYLAAKFGEDWETYKRHVPVMFWPYRKH